MLCGMRGDEPMRAMNGQLAVAFGVRVGGVALLLPDDLACEFIAQVAIHPLPCAAPRVLGLTQLRGQPVVVLEPQAGRRRSGAQVLHLPVLVMGVTSESAALHVAAAPHPVATGGPVDAPLPHCAFTSALRGALAGDGPDPGLWWRFEPLALFECLARSP